jgi:hypothetical protein
MVRRGLSHLSGGGRSTWAAGDGRAQSRAGRESAAPQEREGEVAWAWEIFVEQDLPGNADSALEPVGQARETQRGTWPQLRPPMRQGLSAAQAG